MFAFEEISVRYGTTSVLDCVSATFEPNSLNVLIGPNGTGKSSLLKAIAGLVPSTGAIELEGNPLLSNTDRGNAIAYMQQDVGPTSSLTVLEVVLLGRLKNLGFRVPRDLCEEVENMLETLGVAHLMDRTLAELSGGQRQLVYLSQALFRQPRVLLLDEPTAALDLRNQLLVMDAVRAYVSENSVIVIAAMHDLTLSARFADRIFCLFDGEIYANGSPASVLTTDIISKTYGVRTQVNRDDEGNLAIIPIAPIGIETEE